MVSTYIVFSLLRNFGCNAIVLRHFQDPSSTKVFYTCCIEFQPFLISGANFRSLSFFLYGKLYHNPLGPKLLLHTLRSIKQPTQTRPNELDRSSRGFLLFVVPYLREVFFGLSTAGLVRRIWFFFIYYFIFKVFCYRYVSYCWIFFSFTDL